MLYKQSFTLAGPRPSAGPFTVAFLGQYRLPKFFVCLSADLPAEEAPAKLAKRWKIVSLFQQLNRRHCISLFVFWEPEFSENWPRALLLWQPSLILRLFHITQIYHFSVAAVSLQ